MAVAGIIVIIVSCLYGGLMAVAAVLQMRQSKRLDVIMLAGAMLVIAANFVGKLALPVVIAGLLAIHVAAYLNGKRNGKVNLSHHLVRLALSLGIVALFWFS